MINFNKPKTMHSKEMVLKKFYDNLASSEDYTYYFHPVGIERKEKLFKLLSSSSSDKVCELGCGDGNLSSELVNKAKQVVGVDIALTRAQRATNKGIIAICADVTCLPFIDQVFDKVICSEVIEHLINPKDVLLEIRRVLKSNGIAVMTVPIGQVIDKSLLDVSDEDLEQLDYGEIKTKYKIKDDHLIAFSEKSFIDLLRNNKFIIDAMDYTYDYRVRNKLCNILLKLSLFIETKIIKNDLDRLYTNIFNKWIFYLYYRTETKHHLIVRIKNSEV